MKNSNFKEQTKQFVFILLY